MNERLKRILLITGFVLVVGLLASGLYYLFFRTEPSPQSPVYTPSKQQGQLPKPGAFTGGATGTTSGEQLPSIGGIPQDLKLPSNAPLEQPRTVVLSTAVNQHVSVSPSGGVRGYNPTDGKFYKINDAGQATLLSNQSFPAVERVNWGNVSDKAIITFPDGSNVLYDFTTQQQTTLPKHWEDFGFSPKDGQIAAKIVGNNETNRFLTIANPDGTNAQLIAEMGNNQDKVHVSWSPNDQIVAYSFTGDPLGYDQQAVVMVGKHQENLKNLVVEGRGFIPSWSPSGNVLLYSVWSSTTGFLPTLWLSGANTGNMNDGRRMLSVNTWADKCAWQNEQTIVCGVPTQMKSGAGLQRAVQEGVPDRIVKINVNTGAMIDLGQPDGGATVINPVVSKDGTELYFGDPTLGSLYRFKL